LGRALLALLCFTLLYLVVLDSGRALLALLAT
jgi:hypothetical protein